MDIFCYFVNEFEQIEAFESFTRGMNGFVCQQGCALADSHTERVNDRELASAMCLKEQSDKREKRSRAHKVRTINDSFVTAMS